MSSLGFWGKLDKPIIGLAPLYDVTDAAFRQIIAKYGKPDVMFTEFVSADGLMHEKGREKILANHLGYSEQERPIVAQLFTSRPEKMRAAARFCKELGFDGVDINMGCPDKTIEKQGCGASLIKQPELAKELVAAAKESGLPVSVKTRLGYNKIDLDWIKEILSAAPAALIVHLRTRSEMSKVPARWETMLELVKLAHTAGALILGNGDMETPAAARAKCKQYGSDGVLIGRGIFGNPWLFSEYVPTPEERKQVLAEHIKLFDELLPHKNFAVMKKHFKAYLHDKELRNKLMLAETPVEALGLL